MSETVRYCYSFDEERYFGDFASRGDALAEGSAEADGDPGETHTIYTAEIRRLPHFMRKDSRLGESIVEHIDARYCDEVYSDSDAILELTPEKTQELAKMVTDFIEVYGHFPHWTAVKPIAQDVVLGDEIPRDAPALDVDLQDLEEAP
jgi:hypothetical protein